MNIDTNLPSSPHIVCRFYHFLMNVSLSFFYFFTFGPGSNSRSHIVFSCRVSSISFHLEDFLSLSLSPLPWELEYRSFIPQDDLNRSPLCVCTCADPGFTYLAGAGTELSVRHTRRSIMWTRLLLDILTFIFWLSWCLQGLSTVRSSFSLCTWLTFCEEMVDIMPIFCSSLNFHQLTLGSTYRSCQ